jgi:hypothetical protein
MTQPNGRYHFRSWVRRGVGADAGDPDGPGLHARASVDVVLQVDAVQGSSTVDANPAPMMTVQLYGPGDVIGIDPRHIVRTEPRDLTVNFEPTYLAGIEFDQPDFPWLFTPARPNGDRLRPWLALIVLKADEYTSPKVPPNPLPVIDVTSVAALQSLDDAWNWSHAQISGDGDLTTTVQSNPAATVSRLLCPRRLDPETSYTAFLVPAFDIGRQAGLGLDVSGVTTADPAWTTHTNAPLRMPVYYRFGFRTSDAGDFESLVRKLTPTVLPADVGTAPMAVDTPAPGVPSAGGPLGLEGALRSAATVSTAWSGPAHDAFQNAVQNLINEAVTSTVDDPDNPLPADPRIVPPAYGIWHAAATSVDRGQPGWLPDLNLDPRNRAGAGMGTQIVAAQRVALLASAWDQVDGVIAANQVLRQAQLSRAALAPVWGRLSPTDASSLLTLTAPVHSRMLASPRTVKATLASGPAPARLLTGAFRRVARPLGPVVRRAAALSGALPGSARVARTPVLARINAGALRVTPAPAPPPGVTTVNAIAGGPAAAAATPAAPLGLLRRLARWLSTGAGLLVLIAVVVLLLLVLAGLTVAGAASIPVAVAIGAIAVVAAVAVVVAGRRTAGVTASATLPTISGPASVNLFAGVTAASVRAAPAAPTFAVTQPPAGALGMAAAASVSARPGAAAGPDSPDASRLRTAAAEMLDAIHAAPVDPPAPAPLNLDALRTTVLTRLNPSTTVPARIAAVVHMVGGAWFAADPLEPIMAAPSFPQPMYVPLRDLNQDYLLPGVELIPPDTLGAVVANHRFIEAYMVGLNHEMARQLLWHGYPTDQRGSYFRQFWDVAGYVPHAGDPTDPAALAELLKDIPPIHTWSRSAPLGDNENRTNVVVDNVVLLVRGELLRRYPNTVIFAGRAKPGTGGEHGRVLDDTDERYPIFRGTLAPDITFFGFDLSVDDARGGTAAAPEGYFFVFQEQPTETRFGLEPLSTGTVARWADLAWTNFASGPPPPPGPNRTTVAIDPTTRTLTSRSVSSVFSGLHPTEIASYRVASAAFAAVLTTHGIPDFLTATGAPAGVVLDGSNPDDTAAGWGRDSAQTASILLRLPFRILVHADSLLPRPS